MNAAGKWLQNKFKCRFGIPIIRAIRLAVMQITIKLDGLMVIAFALDIITIYNKTSKKYDRRLLNYREFVYV